MAGKNARAETLVEEEVSHPPGDVLAYVRALWRHKWGMAALFALSTAAAFVRTMYLVPEIFEGRATFLPVLLPVKETVGGGTAAAVLHSLSTVTDIASNLGVAAGFTASDRLVTILESETVRVDVAKKYGILSHFLRRELTRERRRRETFSPTDIRRVALELANAHPDILRAVVENDPERGILSMSDVSLRKMIAELPGLEGEPDETLLPEIRRQWHRVVADTLATFVKSLSVSASRANLVTVRAEIADDPFLAANVANGMVERLDQFLRENVLTQAGRTRRFLEEQVNNTKARLLAIEKNLEDYKAGRRVAALPEQLSEWVKRAGEVQAQLEAKKIAREVLNRSALSRFHPQVVALDAEISALSRQLRELEAGKTTPITSVGVVNAPRVERELSDLMRDRVVQETLYTLLVQQYELARIQEEGERPSFQRLDVAQPAARRLKPRRSIDVMLGAALGLLLGLAYAFVREATTERRYVEGER